MRTLSIKLLPALALMLLHISSAYAEPMFVEANTPAKWYYLDGAEAEQMVSEAQAEAAAVGRNVVIIFGTQSCHDTRALLEWLDQPEVARALHSSFDFQLVESGRAKDRNLMLARKFGVDRIEGTPTLLILSGRDGKLLNRGDIAKLRNAARQTPDQRMDYFQQYLPEKATP